MHRTLGGLLEGVVVDVDTGQPVLGPHVQILEESRTGGLMLSPRPVECQSDASGRFSLTGSPEGTFGLETSAVVTTYADPSSSLMVTVREIGREDGVWDHVGHEGQFSFEHVSLGRVEVVLTDQYDKLGLSEVAFQVRQVVVQDGETVAVNFDAATGVTLGGRVVGRDKPLLIEAQAMEAEEKAPSPSPSSPTPPPRGCSGKGPHVLS